MNAKLRMEQRKWKEQDWDAENGFEAKRWSELEDSEKMIKAEEDAAMRQIFDPVKRTLNFSRKRVTDSRHNNFSKLPSELPPELETYIDLWRSRFRGVFQIQLDELQHGTQQSNLSWDQAQGLRTLEKRVKEGDLIILKTDKSEKW